MNTVYMYAVESIDTDMLIFHNVQYIDDLYQYCVTVLVYHDTVIH